MSATADRAHSETRAALRAIVSEGFFSRLGFGLIAFALPLYARRLGLGVGEIGLLLSLNVATSMLLKPVVGRVVDRMGYKRGACLAIVARGALAALLVFAGSAWQLYAIQSARGGAKSLRDPSIHALIMEHGGSQRLASAFAWYQTAKSVAGALGKALAGALLTLSGSNFHWVFGIAILLSLVPLGPIGRFVPSGRHARPPVPPPEVTRAGRAEHSGPQGSGMGLRLLPIAGLGCILSGTANMLHGLLPVLAVEYAGLSEAETGLIYLVSTGVVLAAGPAFGWFSDHVSRGAVLATRSLANTLSSLIFLVWPEFAGFALGKGVDDVGKAAFRPAWGVLMAESATREGPRRAQAVGLMSAGEDAGSVVGPILAGLLWSTGGVTALLGTRAALALVGEVYTALLVRTRARSGASRDAVTAGRVPEPGGP